MNNNKNKKVFGERVFDDTIECFICYDTIEYDDLIIYDGKPFCCTRCVKKYHKRIIVDNNITDFFR